MPHHTHSSNCHTLCIVLCPCGAPRTLSLFVHVCCHPSNSQQFPNSPASTFGFSAYRLVFTSFWFQAYPFVLHVYLSPMCVYICIYIYIYIFIFIFISHPSKPVVFLAKSSLKAVGGAASVYLPILIPCQFMQPWPTPGQLWPSLHYGQVPVGEFQLSTAPTLAV